MMRKHYTHTYIGLYICIYINPVNQIILKPLSVVPHKDDDNGILLSAVVEHKSQISKHDSAGPLTVSKLLASAGHHPSSTKAALISRKI